MQRLIPRASRATGHTYMESGDTRDLRRAEVIPARLNAESAHTQEQLHDELVELLVAASARAQCSYVELLVSQGLSTLR